MRRALPASAAEIKAVVAALEGEYPEDATSRDMALRAIEALDAVRDKADKFISVIGIKLPETKWHYFATGPYSTEIKARTESLKWMPSTMKYKHDGECKFQIIPIGNDQKQAWENIRPAKGDPHQWIKDMVKEWTPTLWFNRYTAEGWGHKPPATREAIDTRDDHA